MENRHGNQLRTFEALLQTLRPHLRVDRNLPARIQKLLTGEKRFGSRDRRLYRELLYTTVRYLPWFEELAETSTDRALRAMVWLSADTRATQDLRASPEFDFGPLTKSVARNAALLGVHRSLVPDWLEKECPAAVRPPNSDVLQTRAPLWLRLQTGQLESVFEEFTRNDWSWRRSEIFPLAVEVFGEVDVTKTQVFAEGKIEVQDLGSQLVLGSCGVHRGERWLDACAGAGGKTLFLADVVGPEGRVTAHDTRIGALHTLRERALRASFRNVEITTRPTGTYDAVLVDAPCTGTGTWRRSPHLKWCTGPREIADAQRLQGKLLNEFSPAVRNGGRLVYATCSLCRSENEDVIDAFLTQHPEFFPGEFAQDFGVSRQGAGLNLLPATFNTDGFYVACLRRK